MRTRSIVILICLIAGILSAFYIELRHTIYVLIAVAVLIVTAGFFLTKKIYFALFLVLCMAFGAAVYTAKCSTKTGFENKFVTVTGRISELPYTYDNEIYYYVISPHTLTHIGKSYSFDKRVRVSSEKQYQYGDCISVGGFLEEFNSKMNDTGFDSYIYNKSRSVFYKMNEYESKYAKRYYTISARDIMLYIQNKCALYIDSRYDDKARAYLRAFIIGDMRSFDDALSDILVFSGAKRFLYSSYIHISIILFILGFCFDVFRTKRNTRDTVTALILLIYCACMNTMPTFMRALVSMAFIFLYRMKFGYINKGDALAVSGTAVLITNPMMLFDAGFVIAMVFGAVNIMFSNHLSQFLGGIRYSIVRFVVGNIGILPMYAVFFSGASLLYPITHIVAFPVTFAVIASFHIGMLSDTLLGLTMFSDTVLASLLFLYDSVAHLISSIPFSYVFFACPTAYQLCLFYGIVISIYSRITQRKHPKRTLLPITISVCMAIIVMYGYISDIGKAKLLFVNVGQGDGAVVSVNYKEKLLIDGGGSSAYSKFNTGRHIYVPFLHSHGINKADAIVTHYHKDHCEGIVEAIKSIDVGTVFMPDCAYENEWRIKIESAARKHGTRIEFVKCGDKIEYPSGLCVEFISPDETDLKSNDLNCTSLVAYISYGDFSALFTGDIPKETENKLLLKQLVRDCDVLKLAHHGADTSSGDAFINAVSPEVALIGVGENNSFGQPSEEVLSRLDGVDIMRTDKNGNVTIVIDKNGEYIIDKFR